jgi:hypothetical protein
VCTLLFDISHNDINEKAEMSDKQPLLEKSSKLSRENDDDAGNTNNKRTLAETYDKNI